VAARKWGRSTLSTSWLYLPPKKPKIFRTAEVVVQQAFPQVKGCSEVGIQQQVRCVSVPSNIARKPSPAVFNSRPNRRSFSAAEA